MNTKNSTTANAPAAPGQGINPAADTVAFLKSLGLPPDTSDKELAVILQANVGAMLPFKAAVFPALIRLAMQDQWISEHEAKTYVAQKFPNLPPAARPQSGAEAATNLRARLIELYGLPDNAADDAIIAVAAAEKNYSIRDKALHAQEAAEEVLIAQKVGIMLTRDQAINIIRRQREYDAELKRSQDERRPRLIEIIKTCSGDLGLARKLCRDEFPFLDGAEFKAAASEAKKLATEQGLDLTVAWNRAKQLHPDLHARICDGNAGSSTLASTLANAATPTALPLAQKSFLLPKFHMSPLASNEDFSVAFVANGSQSVRVYPEKIFLALVANVVKKQGVSFALARRTVREEYPKLAEAAGQTTD